MPRRTGFANLPLHPGQALAWLFTHMTRLAREIATRIVADRGPEELLRPCPIRSGSRRSAASSDSTGIPAVLPPL